MSERARVSLARGQISRRCWSQGVYPGNPPPRSVFSKAIIWKINRIREVKRLNRFTPKGQGEMGWRRAWVCREDERERESPERGEFWRQVFGESEALEMKYLGVSTLGEDEWAGQEASPVRRRMCSRP